MKIIKKSTIASLTVVFLLAPINLSGIADYFANAQDSEEISGEITWDSDHTISGELIITPDSKLTIKRGVTITFDGGSIRSDRGTIITEGTTEEPVKFRNANEPSQDSFYSIFLTNNSVGDFKNAEFSGGGLTANAVPAYNQDLFNRAFASAFRTGAVDIQNSRLLTDGCVFKNNINAITIGHQQDTSSYIQVNRTRFEDSNDFFVEYDDSQYGTLDFQYNWWGAGGAPSQGKISGALNTSNSAPRADFHDPVIIVPGIMGSWNGQIDPILHTYDNLYEEFASNGYIPEQDLFTFPYEWRDSNITNAVKLRNRISEIRSQTHWPKVDIVAHSMGGLLARKYIESGYQTGIDQFITIGTPQLGAPKSYLMWEGGEFLGFWSFTYKHILEQEAKENGFDDIDHYIQGRPMNSVRELLPVYNYLYDVDNNYDLRASYPDNYPRNEFLENLNISDNLNLLKKVEFTKIIGQLNDSESTISGYNVEKSIFGDMWKDGYPKNFYYPILMDEGLKNSDGDRTVPLYSAESASIPSDYTIHLASEHSDLPTDAQKDILETLTGTIPANEVRHSLLHDALIVTVFSPVDIQIVSPSGKRVGKDFANGKTLNEIPNAFYTGYQEPCANNPKKMCEVKSEFVTVPNPEKGNYQILTQGTGNGDFDIELAKISKNPDDPQKAEEVTETIEGATEPAEETETAVDVQEDQIVAGETETKTNPVSSLIQKVEDYFAQGLIKTKQERNYLRSNLRRINFLFNQIDRVNGKAGMKDAQKAKRIANLKKRINTRVDVIINHIQFKSKNQIDPPTAKSLTQDLNALRS